MIVAQLRGIKFKPRGRYMWPTNDDTRIAIDCVSDCAEWLGFKGENYAALNLKYTRALQRERKNIFKRAKD